MELEILSETQNKEQMEIFEEFREVEALKAEIHRLKNPTRPLTWNQYFMNIARAVSARSKDPNTKVGVVIVTQDNRIISTGYNGMPAGIDETPDMWEKPKKYDFVLHAELNAIVYCKDKGFKLYSTMFPCRECAKVIAAAGIKEVYYSDMKYDNEVTREIFSKCNIKLDKINSL